MFERIGDRVVPRVGCAIRAGMHSDEEELHMVFRPTVDRTRTPLAGPTSPQGQRLPPARRSLGRLTVSLLTTTDHKVIGQMYIVAAFAFFILGGVMAMVIRAELAQPG